MKTMTKTHPAFELRIALGVAARAACLDGATDEQINTIVALARGSNDYNIIAGGRLTRGEAARIIDHMFDEGIDPEFRKFEEELAAEREQAARIAASAAAKKIAKQQDKDAKAAREETHAAKDRATEGQRVYHAKFGEGTVVSEDEKSMTVIFDSQKKSLRVGREFLTSAESRDA